MGVDALSGVGFAFFILTVFAYLVIVWRVYSNLRIETEKLSVMVVRLALFLPIYALLIYIALNAPHALVALNIPIAIVEGYTFYCFFALIVHNLGGPAQTVQYFKDSGKPLMCCTSLCPADHIQYYKKATWAMFHLVFTRVIVIILAAIAFYSGSKAGNAISALLNLVGAFILFYCLAHLVLLYENIFTHCTNLYGVTKILLLKCSVGLIVVQGIVEALMVATNSEPYTDDSTWNSEDKTIRGYCFLVLLEFVILCLPYLWAYTYTISDPPKPIHEQNATVVNSFFGFYCKVLNVFDVCGVLTYKDEINAPLTGGSSNKI